jgi:hypothetical protein
MRARIEIERTGDLLRNGDIDGHGGELRKAGEGVKPA